MSRIAGWLDFGSHKDRSSEQLVAMLAEMHCVRENSHTVWTDKNAGLGKLIFGAPEADADQITVVGEGASALAVAFAGAIYNLPDLKEKLMEHGVIPTSDAAPHLVGLAYKCFGPTYPAYLEGAFAIAVFDKAANRLCLSRDRLGIEPLYVYTSGQSVTFASVLKSFWKDPDFKPVVDVDNVSMLLQPRIARPGETPLKNVEEAHPAHTEIIDASGRRRVPYWTLTSRLHSLSFEETSQHTRALLEQAVSKRVPSTGDLSSMLSGGLDSTTVTALTMQKLQQTGNNQVLNTLCIDFGDAGEDYHVTKLRPEVDAPYAIKAAQHIGTSHQTLTVGVEDMFAVLPDTYLARGLPGWGQFDASMLILFREMSKLSNCGVTGECADEIFGGYPHFFSDSLIDSATFPWLPDVPRLGHHLRNGIVSGFDPIADEENRYARMISEMPRVDGETPEDTRMREVFYVTLGGRLNVLLDRMDRMCAVYGVMMHLPFCDTELWEFAWNMPWSIKSQGGEKGILKHAMQDLLPASTLNRKKSAYPEIQKSAYSSMLVNEATQILDNPEAPSHALFSHDSISKLVTDLDAGNYGHNAEHVLIQYVDIDKWMTTYGVNV